MRTDHNISFPILKLVPFLLGDNGIVDLNARSVLVFVAEMVTVTQANTILQFAIHRRVVIVGYGVVNGLLFIDFSLDSFGGSLGSRFFGPSQSALEISFVEEVQK